MSYLHCHGKDCHWSQDDFYSKRYNPLTKIWSDIKWLWKPRWINLDNWIIEDITKYTGVKVYRQGPAVSNNVFTWNWLLVEIVKDLKNAYNMKWWTYNSFKKEKNKVCPKCGSKNLDID